MKVSSNQFSDNTYVKYSKSHSIDRLKTSLVWCFAPETNIGTDAFYPTPKTKFCGFQVVSCSVPGKIYIKHIALRPIINRNEKFLLYTFIYITNFFAVTCQRPLAGRFESMVSCNRIVLRL